MSQRERFPSWSLRDHYAAQSPTLQGKGRALCNGSTAVYEVSRLARYGFDPDLLNRPRKLCKFCERKAS